MATEPPVPDARALWQHQPAEGASMSAVEVRRKSEALLEQARRRATLIYVVGAGNAGIPIVLMWFLPELRLALGYLVVTAVALVSYVRRRSAILRISPMTAADHGLGFYRHLLARERDFRRDSTRWFTIGPTLNILVLGLAYVNSPLFHAAVPELSAMTVIVLTHVVVLTRAVGRLKGEARGYQLELDALGGQVAQV